jgi:hypothetical protein
MHCSKLIGSIASALLGLATSGHASTFDPLTGGDWGKGLSLTSASVIHAYNINGEDAIIQGIQFNALSLGYPDTTGEDPFSIAPENETTNDTAARSLLQTMTWEESVPISIEFSGLAAVTDYQLSLLYFAGGFASREQAAIVNDQLIDLFTVSQTTAYNMSFVAKSDASGMIRLQIAASGNYGGTGNQDGAILSGVVLSAVIPEPASYAAIIGLAVLSAVWLRHRKRQ